MIEADNRWYGSLAQTTSQPIAAPTTSSPATPAAAGTSTASSDGVSHTLAEDVDAFEDTIEPATPTFDPYRNSIQPVNIPESAMNGQVSVSSLGNVAAEIDLSM